MVDKTAIGTNFALLYGIDEESATGTFVSWIALDGDRIIGTSGMSFVEKPPYFGCPNGKIGLLSGMFTANGYRRRGIAKALLENYAVQIMNKSRF